MYRRMGCELSALQNSLNVINVYASNLAVQESMCALTS